MGKSSVSCSSCIRNKRGYPALKKSCLKLALFCKSKKLCGDFLMLSDSFSSQQIESGAFCNMEPSFHQVTQLKSLLFLIHPPDSCSLTLSYSLLISIQFNPPKCHLHQVPHTRNLGIQLCFLRTETTSPGLRCKILGGLSLGLVE